MGEAKRNRFKWDWTRCAYCGEPATGKDHVPPKGLFIRSGYQMITVPACDAHNTQRSGLDERFREFVMFHVRSEHTPLFTELWERNVRGIRRNPRKLAEYLGKIRWYPKTDQERIYLEAEPFYRGVEWVCRGLYWRHTNRSLPLDVKFKVHMINPDAEVPDELRWNELTLTGQVGMQFHYKGGIVHGRPNASIWYVFFHTSVVALAISDWQPSDELDLKELEGDDYEPFHRP